MMKNDFKDSLLNIYKPNFNKTIKSEFDDGYGEYDEHNNKKKFMGIF